jgi:ABC-type nickel/cobalt efflux system permease component RcnA
MWSEVPARTMTTTQTSHEPGPDELSHATPHDETEGHDDHAHGSEALGPVDVQAWGAFAVGIALGLIVAVCVALSTGAI